MVLLDSIECGSEVMDDNPVSMVYFDITLTGTMDERQRNVYFENDTTSESYCVHPPVVFRRR